MHTGKPVCALVALLVSERAAEVYPRAYGETNEIECRSAASWGLPPCIRGNPGEKSEPAGGSRSTPVHTGKPAEAEWLFHIWQVYPRAYGETSNEHRNTEP